MKIEIKWFEDKNRFDFVVKDDEVKENIELVKKTERLVR